MVNYVQITQLRTIGSNPAAEDSSSSMSQCYLQWRDKTLIVKQDRDLDSLDVVALKSDWWLVNCLQKSPIKRIHLTPSLGEEEVKKWAVAGEKTNKQMFLRLPSDRNLSLVQNTLAWKVKRTVDFTLALSLILLLSPIGLAIALKQKLAGKAFLEKQWCIGRRGVIFKTFNWATGNYSGFWSRQGSIVGINKLPQLIKVLRGEMSLIGHYPFSLDEAFCLNAEQRKVLNIAPGIVSITPWRSPQLDLRAISSKSYVYLCHWSLLRDFKILLLILPRLLRNQNSRHKTIKL